MAQATETRDEAAQGNVQDAFLNAARRERVPVTIHLLDGRLFEACIKNFDRFAVVVEVEGADHLIFKHAIATIGTQRSAANYFDPRQA